MNRNRTWIVTLLLLALLGLTTGCASVNAMETAADAPTPAPTKEIPVDLEIREKLFVAQTNDVYVNAPDYLGKTIKYEGMFSGFTYGPENLPFWMVMRYGPGCCGTDGTVGFEVAWDDETIEQPTENDWVEVVGKLVEYDEDGVTYLRLDVLSMTKLAKRGQETVLQ